MLTTTEIIFDPATITLTRPRPGLALVTLGGEIDLAAVERLEEVFAAVGGCPEVVLDVAGVGFVECAGLHPLVDAARAAVAGGGRLVLRDPSPAVVDLIAWCHLGEELPVEAVRARRRRAGAGGRLARSAVGAARS